MRVRSLGREDRLQTRMAIHSILLAREIPRTEEPGGLHSAKSRTEPKRLNKTTIWLVTASSDTGAVITCVTCRQKLQESRYKHSTFPYTAAVIGVATRYMKPHLSDTLRDWHKWSPLLVCSEHVAWVRCVFRRLRLGMIITRESSEILREKEVAKYSVEKSSTIKSIFKIIREEMVSLLDRVIQESFLINWYLVRHLKEIRVPAMRISGCRALQAGRTGTCKVLRQEHAWSVCCGQCGRSTVSKGRVVGSELRKFTGGCRWGRLCGPRGLYVNVKCKGRWQQMDEWHLIQSSLTLISTSPHI